MSRPLRKIALQASGLQGYFAYWREPDLKGAADFERAEFAIALAPCLSKYTQSLCNKV